VFPFELVDTTSLPPADLTLLQRIWTPMMVASAIRTRIGLQGDGPWPLLLPGHVVHAHAPAAPANAYIPQPGDEDYPPIPIGLAHP
jgi:hypothetical protein